MKLFMVYLGGTAPGANIELHDIRFVVGADIEATFEQLRQQWFGDIKGLHLDSYLQLTDVDGYSIELVTEPVATDQQLYFVNFGGYYPDKLAEQHAVMLCVAESAAAAKARAKAQLLTDCHSPHKDDLLQVDECLLVSQLGAYFIKLTPGGSQQPLVPDWFGYRVIG